MEKRRASELYARQGVTTMKEAFEELLKVYRLQSRYKEFSITAFWEKIMGAPIAQRTIRLFIKNEVLYVELDSAPLKHELNMTKTKITQLVNKHAGENMIRTVIFM